MPATSRWKTLFELLEDGNPTNTLQTDVSNLCAELTFVLNINRNCVVGNPSHVVALETGGVGISVFSSIRRVELQLWEEHLHPLMLLHETFARLFHQKLSVGSFHAEVFGRSCLFDVSEECVSDMTKALVTLLESINKIKMRIKCLSDVSKLLQRCRKQSIYFLALHVPPPNVLSASERAEIGGEMPEWNDIVAGECTHFGDERVSAASDVSLRSPSASNVESIVETKSAINVTVPFLTDSVVENVLYGYDTFPSTATESELVAVLWMFVLDYHARPNVLCRMICHNTWTITALVPMMGISLFKKEVVVVKKTVSAPAVRDTTPSRGRGVRTERLLSRTSGETWLIIYAFFHGELISKLLNYRAAMRGERSMYDVALSAVPVDRLLMKVIPHPSTERHFRAQQRNRETTGVRDDAL